MNPKIFLDMVKNFSGKGGDIELPVPENKFDVIINGINRIGRPLLLVGVVAFFIWGIADPEYFTTVMKAYATTPEFVATAILMVIGIFGGGRIVGDFKKRATVKQTISTTVEKQVSDGMASSIMREGRFANLDDNNPEVAEAGEEIVSMEPENSAIEAWKRKRNKRTL